MSKVESDTFAAQAPAYWDAGYSVVPIAPNSKRPTIMKWSGYCNNLPSEQKRKDWLGEFGECGVGLLLGTEISPEFCIIAIDIDDDRLVRPVQAFLDGSCSKVGRKGITIFAKSPRDAKIKATTLKGPEGLAGDLLASGKMTVLPPTRHPDTEREYVWVGSSLLESGFADLPLFDVRAFSVLKVICRSAHLAELNSGEATHTPALQFVAQLVKAGASDEEIERIVVASLPTDYSGDTLAQIPEMISSARVKGFSSDKDEAKDATIAIQIVEACLQQGAELFRCEDRAFISFSTETGGCRTYPLRSRSTERKIRHLWYVSQGRSMGPMILNEVIATLETKAFADGKIVPVWNRVGELEGSIFVDLGRDDGQLVRIDSHGWTTCYDPRLKFHRPDGFRELPAPNAPGDLRALQVLLGLSDDVFHSIAGFMISSMAPTGPYFGLVIEGEMGSGKSVLASTLKALIDPADADRLSLPNNTHDLAIQAKQFRLLSFDNASGIKADISDALCRVATGGGIATRRLYTDDELSTLKTSRPFMLNGISGYARRPDLIERVIYVHLERVQNELRKDERSLDQEFARVAPTILAGLYDTLSEGLKDIKKGLNVTGFRMADAALRIAASETALGVLPGTILGVIKEGQRTLVIERISSDALTVALRWVLASGPFEGTMKQLHDRLRLSNEDGLPRSPAALSTAFDRQRAALREVGISVKLLQRGKQGRRVRVEYVGPPEDDPASGALPKY